MTQPLLPLSLPPSPTEGPVVERKRRRASTAEVERLRAELAVLRADEEVPPSAEDLDRTLGLARCSGCSRRVVVPGLCPGCSADEKRDDRPGGVR